MKYSLRSFNLSEQTVSELTEVHPYRTLAEVAWIWIVLLTLIGLGGWASQHLSTPYFLCLYPIFAVLLAGRQGALLQIVHEGSHQMIAPHRKLNHFVGQWLAALPVGLNLPGYTSGHLQHHAYTNTTRDLPTDLAKHEFTDLKDFNLYRMFFEDLIGLTALKSLFGHAKNANRKKEKMGPTVFPQLVFCQLVMLTVVFRLDPVRYLLFWVIPLMSFNMVLLRIRGIVEHGLPGQKQVVINKAEEGNYYTRTVRPYSEKTPSKILWALEKMLIGTVQCNYHHEHHLLPKVPFYRLNQLHLQLRAQIEATHPDVYIDSYLQGFLKGKHPDAR